MIDLAGVPARAGTATRMVARVVVYYGVVLAALVLAWPHAERAQAATRGALGGLSLLGATATPVAPPPGAGGAVTAVVAMLGAALFALPVSWVYLLTRAKRGYQQSVVQTLVLLPMVVAGVVVLVKDSLALAFGLAGIVAAVRFRTALDDSKDAVYVFLATGIGLAAAVDLPVAAAISVCFNAAILVLWRTDFGRTPAVLEGRVAEDRLRRARELARTGTFVARIDDEVFREMTSEQLESVAERARRRARTHDPEGAEGGAEDPESLLLVRTLDGEGARLAVEPWLTEQAKRWRFEGSAESADGTRVLEYAVVAKKGRRVEELAELLCASGTPGVITAELG